MTSPARGEPKTLLQDLAPFAAGWTLLVLLLTGFWWRTEQKNEQRLARSRAVTAFRLQAAYHLALMDATGQPRGGAAAVPRRLARTYVRQAGDHGELSGHLTSPHATGEGRPDAWERRALDRLSAGAADFEELGVHQGRPSLRYMGALRMEAACVNCHSSSGAAAGDLLGGISLAIPVVPFAGVLTDPPRRFFLVFILLGWAVVLAATGLARHRQRRAARLERQAADSLQNSEERLKEAQRVANMGYWEHDHRTGRITWSEETFQMFGFPPERTAPTYDAFMDRVHPEDRVRVAEDFHNHLMERRPYQTEFRILREGGEIRHVLASCHTEFDEAGTPLRTLGINLDFTDRRKLDEALKAQAEAHRILLECSLDGFLEVDEAGRILNTNDRYLNLSGYGREQLLGMAARELEATEDSGAVRAQTSRIRRKGMDRYETWHRSRDGRRIPLQVSVTYVPSQGRFLYFLRDLTGERAARQAPTAAEPTPLSTAQG